MFLKTQNNLYKTNWKIYWNSAFLASSFCDKLEFIKIIKTLFQLETMLNCMSIQCVAFTKLLNLEG